MTEKKCKNCMHADKHVSQVPCVICMRKGYPEHKIKWEAKKK